MAFTLKKGKKSPDLFSQSTVPEAANGRDHKMLRHRQRIGRCISVEIVGEHAINAVFPVPLNTVDIIENGMKTVFQA